LSRLCGNVHTHMAVFQKLCQYLQVGVQTLPINVLEKNLNWVARYKLRGIEALVPQSTRPKSQPAELPIRVRERIIELRQETKLCSKKLNYKLAKEGIKVSDRVI